MSAEITNMAAVETPKSSQGVFELPCGYLDPAGVLHTEVELRELTGAEEDLLSSTQTSGFKKYGELLSRCTVRIGNITDRAQVSNAVKMLPIGDRMFLMFKIRTISIGDDYTFESKCPSEACGAVRNYTILLSELEIKKMPDPKKRVFDVVLPSGATARFRTSTGLDEERNASLSKGEDILSRGILLRLELLNGAPPDLAAVKAMKWRDRTALRQAWDRVEGGVDTEMDMTCSVCSTEFKKELELTAGFFFPSVTSKT